MNMQEKGSFLTLALIEMKASTEDLSVTSLLIKWKVGLFKGSLLNIPNNSSSVEYNNTGNSVIVRVFGSWINFSNGEQVWPKYINTQT